MTKRVLLVETDSSFVALVRRSVAAAATVDECFDFETARKQLLAVPYDLLVANLRVRAHNGLHLVYLAQATGTPVHSIVYTDDRDVPLAHEVQESGAFYELRQNLPVALPRYVRAALPERDRRDASLRDRRLRIRGGRRSSDLALVTA